MIKADVLWDGRAYKKTFFPSNWSREKVIRTMFEEVYKNYTEKIQSSKNNYFELLGKTIENIEIRIITDEKNQMITFYPTYKNFEHLI